MSWSDILYPGNPKRRAEVVAKLQQLEDQMKENFRASNKLANYLNKNFSEANIDIIQYDAALTLKQNGDNLVAQVRKIQAIVENIKKKLKEKLEPDLYKKLFDVDTSFEDRIKIGQDFSHIFAGILGATTMGIVGKLVAESLFETIEQTAVRIALSSVAGAIAGGIVGLAVDVIAGAIAGKYEKDDLENAINELNEEIDDFLPASEKYTDMIFEVLAYVKIWEEEHHQ